MPSLFLTTQTVLPGRSLRFLLQSSWFSSISARSTKICFSRRHHLEQISSSVPAQEFCLSPTAAFGPQSWIRSTVTQSTWKLPQWDPYSNQQQTQTNPLTGSIYKLTSTKQQSLHYLTKSSHHSTHLVVDTNHARAVEPRSSGPISDDRWLYSWLLSQLMMMMMISFRALSTTAQFTQTI